jgi:hypothetical protein
MKTLMVVTGGRSSTMRIDGGVSNALLEVKASWKSFLEFYPVSHPKYEEKLNNILKKILNISPPDRLTTYLPIVEWVKAIRSINQMPPGKFNEVSKRVLHAGGAESTVLQSIFYNYKRILEKMTTRFIQERNRQILDGRIDGEVSDMSGLVNGSDVLRALTNAEFLEKASLPNFNPLCESLKNFTYMGFCKWTPRHSLLNLLDFPIEKLEKTLSGMGADMPAPKKMLDTMEEIKLTPKKRTKLNFNKAIKQTENKKNKKVSFSVSINKEMDYFIEKLTESEEVCKIFEDIANENAKALNQINKHIAEYSQRDLSKLNSFRT